MQANEQTVYIGAGSNIRPRRHILQALMKLNEQIPVKRISTHYRTEPLGDRHAHYYINGVWELTTALQPAELKYNVLRRLEDLFGRERSADKNAARTLDLDILLYGNLVMREGGLSIPDPNLTTRDFIVIPLLELAPYLLVPGENMPLTSYKERFIATNIKPLHHYTRKLRRRILT